jgi:parvulin-like peptidyl-prolyl isomerase
VLQRQRAERRPAARLDIADLVQPAGHSVMNAHGLRQHWSRRPALHFALIGALALGMYRAWIALGPDDATRRESIVVTEQDRRDMEAEFRARWGMAPSAAQSGALVNQAVEEELLYRAARSLALDFQDASVKRRLFEKARALNLRPTGGNTDAAQEAAALGLDDDIVIRRLLAEKMRLLLQQDGNGGSISDAEVAAYLEQNRQRFLQPETVTLTQVFLSADKRGAAVTGAAAAARAALGAQPPSPVSARLSDPFPLGTRFSYTAGQLTGRFGKPFADQVLALPAHEWSQPIASPYGLHLVWVEEHRAAQLPALDDVRAPIRLAIIKERDARNLQRGLAQLRALFDVRIDETPAS